MAAQTIRGTARVDGDGQGSTQTTIVLTDTLGAIIAGTTTGEMGTYVLRAPRAGTYRVRARRIGFMPDSSSALVVANDATITFDPVMKRMRAQLAEVRVQESRRCALAPDAGDQALRLWQEAQNALSGAVVSNVSGTTSFVLDRFQRQLDSQGKRVIKSTRWQSATQGSEAYASIAADSLARHGFVRMSGIDAIYYAPDARTLLSDSFARTHCLRPVAGTSGADSVGLAFEPVGQDNRTEVAGTLWLARSTGKLMYLEFEYVDAAARSGGADQNRAHATGRVDYRELASGAWIVSNWIIRVPLLHVNTAHNVTTAFGSYRTDAQPSVTGWWEFGGDVADVTTTQSGSSPGSLAPNTGSLRGTLLETVTHRGVARVEVDVQTVNPRSVAARTITDSAGRFAFDSLSAGDYVLDFTAPRLDTLGTTVPSEAFSIVSGQDLTLSTTVPASGISRSCAAEKQDQRIVHGIVRDSSSGSPVAGASVRMTWIARASRSGAGLVWQPSEAVVATDSAGRYVQCGLPSDRILTEVVTAPGRRPTTVVIPVDTDAVALRNIELSAGANDVGSVSGTARDQTGSGVAVAEVSSMDDPGNHVFTDSHGTFKLEGVPPGFHIIRIRRLGLTPSLVGVRVTSRQVVAVNVVMTATAQVIAKVNVTAPSGEVLRLPADVAHRLGTGQGYYILAGDIRLRDSHSTSDVFRRLQGITVQNDLAVSTRGLNSLLADPCPLGMPIYVDGTPAASNTLDVVAPSEIAAIEVYPTTASMPPSLSPSPCGAIMIWTK